MTTTLIKISEIKRRWHELDATKLSLGRLAALAAKFLIGKHKPSYTPHLDNGDFVVVVNVDKLKTTGRKMLQKEYFHYSGYPGGLKRRKMGDVFAKNPEKIIWKAVYGMLATNRLRMGRLKRLKLVKGTSHKFKIDHKVNI